MKLALIPPHAWADTHVDDYYLILPSQAPDQRHHDAIRVARRKGAFVILDNGIAEGKQERWDVLYDVANEIHANELVLPDVQGDAEATREAVDEVLNWSTWRDPIGSMGVVQGKTMDECFNLIEYYLERSRNSALQCIGLPRCLLTDVEPETDLGVSPFVRAALAQWIRGQDRSIAIHLLGTNPKYIGELSDHGGTFRLAGVRGIDTSAPWTYAARKKWISDGGECWRQPGYLNMSYNDALGKYAEQNINTLVRWVHGTS
jgi:hypothetical protein